MRSTELNCRSLPKSPSRSKMHRLSTSCFNAYISLGNLTGNPCFEPPSCHTRFDMLTWCCKHSFYLDSYLICSVANYMHVTNCYFLLSKSGFCFDILFILFFRVYFFSDFRFFFFSINTWLMCSVWNCLVWDAWTLFTHWHLYYISARLVFLMPNMGGGFLYFVCETLLKGLVFSW